MTAPTPEQMRALADKITGYRPSLETRRASSDALRAAADQLEEAEVMALRAGAAAARARWAPLTCPWVGFLDDRADALTADTAPKEDRDV